MMELILGICGEYVAGDITELEACMKIYALLKDAKIVLK